MFEALAQWPWWIFCAMLICGSSVYGIVMRFVPQDMDAGVFGVLFTGVSSVFLIVLCFAYFISGGSFEYSAAGIAAAVVMGGCLVVADLGIISMYRAGAPLSLGMPLVRAGLALVTAILGIIVFAETFDITKLAGIICACVGIFLLGQRKRQEDT